MTPADYGDIHLRTLAFVDSTLAPPWDLRLAHLIFDLGVPITLKPPSLPPQFSRLVLLKTCRPPRQPALSVEALPLPGVPECWHPILPQDCFQSPCGMVVLAAPLPLTDPFLHLPTFQQDQGCLLTLISWTLQNFHTISWHHHKNCLQKMEPHLYETQ